LKSLIGIAVLTVFLLLGFTSAQALIYNPSQTIDEIFEDWIYGLIQFSAADPSDPDLTQFLIDPLVLEDGGFTSSDQLFVSAKTKFGSSSSSGTVKIHIQHDPPDGASSSTVQVVPGGVCFEDGGPPELPEFCVINQLFVHLASTLPEGLYKITANYTSNNPLSPVITTFILHTLDTTEPDAPTGVKLKSDVNSDTGSSQTDNITKEPDPTITGVAEDGSTVELNSSIDGDLGSGPASTFEIDVSLSEGTHSIIANATDPAGNTSPYSSGVTIKVDFTSPTVTTTVNAELVNLNNFTNTQQFIVTSAFDENVDTSVTPTIKFNTAADGSGTDQTGNLVGSSLTVASTGWAVNTHTTTYDVANGDDEFAELFAITSDISDVAGNPQLQLPLAETLRLTPSIQQLPQP